MAYSSFINNTEATLVKYDTFDKNGKPVLTDSTAINCFYQQLTKIIRGKDGTDFQQKGFAYMQDDIVNVNNYSSYALIVGDLTLKVGQVNRITDSNGELVYVKLVLI